MRLPCCHLALLEFYPCSTDIFKDVAIADGLSIVLKDMTKIDKGFTYRYSKNGKVISIYADNPGDGLFSLNPNDNEIIRKLDKKYCSAEGKTIRDTEVLKVDKMLQEQTWLCQIKLTEGDSAYYSISKEFIEVPAQTRFPDQRYFYGTLYHEMAHSTGAPGRLDRDLTGGFGSKLYAGEELVAELSSAIMSCITGLDSTIKEENLQYLKNWSEVITDDPKIIFSAVAKASAAANMICRELKIEQAQGIDMTSLDEAVPNAETVELSQNLGHLIRY